MIIKQGEKGMSPVLIIGIIGLVAVILGGVYFMTNKPVATPSLQTQPTQTVEPTTETSPTTSAEKGAVKEFKIAGSSFVFTPNKISVKKGDTVRITFDNTQGFHDLTVDGYNVKSKQINAGQNDTIEFVADKAGTFKFYCSVDSHEDKGMVGTLTVE